MENQQNLEMQLKAEIYDMNKTITQLNQTLSHIAQKLEVQTVEELVARLDNLLALEDKECDAPVCTVEED